MAQGEIVDEEGERADQNTQVNHDQPTGGVDACICLERACVIVEKGQTANDDKATEPGTSELE
jgi:hypothetical protein